MCPRACQRLRRDQLLGRAGEFGSRLEQQSDAIEIRAAVGSPYGAKNLRLRRQPLRDRRSGFFCDDFALAPRQIVGD
jgi:hypothetical protein